MLSAVENVTTTAPQRSDTSAAPTALASDFQTFLRMLTAQARYQDPLDPLDSAQYAAQLAQFSMVEQQTQTNTLLTGLLETGFGSNTLAGWLGLDVRLASPTHYNGQEIVIEAEADPIADAYVLIAMDTDGNEAGAQQLSSFDGRASWDAMDHKGSTLPHGNYTFEIAAFLQGREVSRNPAGPFQRVVEAQIANDGPSLVLQDGGVASVSSVVAVRNPDQATE